jgi:hypothetical protein
MENSLRAQQAAKKLSLPHKNAGLQIQGLGETKGCVTRSKINVTLQPHFSNIYKIVVETYILS